MINRGLNQPKDNLLRHQIELLSFINVEQQLVGKFYSNGNVEISLLYTLLDSIMDEIIGKEPVKKVCPNCGYETFGRKKDKVRIKEFCSITFDNEEKSAKLFNKIIWNLYKIRNSFFHEGLNESSQEIIMEGFRKIKEETGEARMSIEEEVDYSQSRLLGKQNLKSLIGQLLIEKLLNV